MFITSSQWLKCLFYRRNFPDPIFRLSVKLDSILKTDNRLEGISLFLWNYRRNIGVCRFFRKFPDISVGQRAGFGQSVALLPSKLNFHCSMGVRVRWNWDRWRRRRGDTWLLARSGGGSRGRGCWGRLRSLGVPSFHTKAPTPPIGRLVATGKAAIGRHLIHDSPPSSNHRFLPTQTPISSHNTKTPQITNLKTFPPKLPLIQTNYWVILKLIEHRFRFTNKGKSPRKRNKTIQRMRDE